MKLGAENRKMVIATVVVAALAVVLVIRMMVELSAPTAAPSTAAGQGTRPAQRIARGANGKLPTANSLDPTLKLDLLKASEQTSANGNPTQLFLYPKLAVAYRVPLLPKFVDELKLRLAYGQTGNQPLYGQKFTPLTFSWANQIERWWSWSGAPGWPIRVSDSPDSGPRSG